MAGLSASKPSKHLVQDSNISAISADSAISSDCFESVHRDEEAVSKSLAVLRAARRSSPSIEGESSSFAQDRSSTTLEKRVRIKLSQLEAREKQIAESQFVVDSLKSQLEQVLSDYQSQKDVIERQKLQIKQLKSARQLQQ